MFRPACCHHRSCDKLFEEYRQVRNELKECLTQHPQDLTSWLTQQGLLETHDRLCPGVCSESYANPPVLLLRDFICPKCLALSRLLSEDKIHEKRGGFTLETGNRRGECLALLARPFFRKGVQLFPSSVENQEVEILLSPHIFDLLGGLIFSELTEERKIPALRYLTGHYCGNQLNLLVTRPRVTPIAQLNLPSSLLEQVLIRLLSQFLGTLKTLSEFEPVWIQPELDLLKVGGLPKSKDQSLNPQSVKLWLDGPGQVALTLNRCRLRPRETFENRLNKSFPPGRIWHLPTSRGIQTTLLYPVEESLTLHQSLRAGLNFYPHLSPLIFIIELFSVYAEDLQGTRLLNLWSRLWPGAPPPLPVGKHSLEVIKNLAGYPIPLDWLNNFASDLETLT